VSQPLERGGICAIEGCQDIVDQPEAAAAAGVPKFGWGGGIAADDRPYANWQQDSWDASGSWNGNPKCYDKMKEVLPDLNCDSNMCINQNQGDNQFYGDCWMARSSRASKMNFRQNEGSYSENFDPNDKYQHYGRRPFAPGWVIASANIDPFIIGSPQKADAHKNNAPQHNMGMTLNHYDRVLK
jgi:hypothetical protein